MEIPSTAHQGIVQYKRILKCITVGYRTGLILGRCLVLKPSTSSSHPHLHHLMQLLLLLLLLPPSSPLPPQSTEEVMSWRGRLAQSFFSKAKVNLVSKRVLRCSITTIPLMYIILHYLIIIIGAITLGLLVLKYIFWCLPLAALFL